MEMDWIIEIVKKGLVKDTIKWHVQLKVGDDKHSTTT
jgi:hypothetical protein